MMENSTSIWNDALNILNENHTFQHRTVMIPFAISSIHLCLQINALKDQRSYIATTKHGGIRKDSISSPKFYVAFYLGQKQKPTTKPALNPLPSLAAVCLNSHCDHSPFIWAHWLPNQVSPESGHPCATEVRAGEWETSGRWVTVARVRVPPSWCAVQSYSRNSQNLLNFAQQTSEDDPRLSLILTTLKKEENTQIFWVKKWIWKYWQSTFPK